MPMRTARLPISERKGQPMNPEVKAKPRQTSERRARSRGGPAVLTIGRDGVVSPFVTHWSRIFYHDLFTGNTHGNALDSASVGDGERRQTQEFEAPHVHRSNVETIVTRKHPDRDEWIPRFRTPIEAAVILLGIYVAIYLTVAGIVHAVGSPDAAAAAKPDTSIAAHSVEPVAPPVAAAGSLQRESLGEETERSTEEYAHDHVD